MGKKKTEKKNVTFSYFNWGPFLMYTTITPEECQSLIDGGAKSRLNPQNSMVIQPPKQFLAANLTY